MSTTKMEPDFAFDAYHPRFKEGDKVRFKNDHDIVREILSVRPTGYDWKYPENEEVFVSENSSDPHLYWWEKA